MTTVNRRDSRRSAIHVSDGSHHITLHELTVAPKRYSAVDIQATVHDVEILRSTLEGGGVTGSRATDNTSRSVRINGAPYDDPDDWPTDIVMAGSDISGFSSDLIQIGGGRRITVRNNFLRDPQRNKDHNDGVQSYGSDRLRIEGNRFSAEGANGPNQAVILAHHPTIDGLRVARTTVKGNLVASWPGTGILLAGTEDTTVIGSTWTSSFCRQHAAVRHGDALSAAGVDHLVRIDPRVPGHLDSRRLDVWRPRLERRLSRRVDGGDGVCLVLVLIRGLDRSRQPGAGCCTGRISTGQIPTATTARGKCKVRRRRPPCGSAVVAERCSAAVVSSSRPGTAG